MFHVPAHKNTTNPPAQIVGATFKEHTMSKMDNLDAIMAIESDVEDEDLLRRAWQHLVDNGMAWKLQGWYGRTASSLIAQGFIHAPSGLPA